MPMLERNYWQLLKAGDKDAFNHLYNLYFDALYGFGMQFTQKECVVQDCIQELFIHLWNNHKQLPDVYYVKSYLYRSLRNRIFNSLKKDAVYKGKIEKNIEDNAYLNFTLSHEHLLITRESDEETEAHLHRAMKGLTNHQREAIFLRFYENMEYEEIAATLALKDVKYARTLIYRSLEGLKNGLNQMQSTRINPVRSWTKVAVCFLALLFNS